MKQFWQNLFNVIILIILLPPSFSQTKSPAEDKMYLNNPNYQSFMSLYDLYKIDNCKIVMLGNSITHGVNWGEILRRSDVAGRGIPGDILQGFIARADKIMQMKPKFCFIMGGVNDIYSWIPVETVFNQYKELIFLLKSSKITPVIQSTLFTASTYPNSDTRNKEIAKLNDLLKDFAIKNKLDFIDLNTELSKDGNLIPEYTIDGVHLNWKAYKIWSEKLMEYLRINKI